MATYSLSLKQASEQSFSVPAGGGNTTFYIVPANSYAILSYYGLGANTTLTITSSGAAFTVLTSGTGVSNMGPLNLLSPGANIRMSNSAGAPQTAVLGIIEFQ